MEERLSPVLKAWFPEGLEDPKIWLLNFDVEQADFWEGPSCTIAQLIEVGNFLATVTEMSYCENKKIALQAALENSGC